MRQRFWSGSGSTARKNVIDFGEMSEREFWQRAYLSAMANGCNTVMADVTAERAVEHLRRRDARAGDGEEAGDGGGA